MGILLKMLTAAHLVVFGNSIEIMSGVVYLDFVQYVIFVQGASIT